MNDIKQFFGHKNEITDRKTWNLKWYFRLQKPFFSILTPYNAAENLIAKTKLVDCLPLSFCCYNLSLVQNSLTFLKKS